MLELITKTRTVRRFKQEKPIPPATLEELLNLARLGGSARNCQPWQYAPVTDADECAVIFPYLGWAGYLADWKGPEPGERPAAYILCLLNRRRLKGNDREAHFDLGIASQNLLLGAMEQEIGGCRIGAFSPDLAKHLNLAEEQELALVIALGYPAEQVVLEACASEDAIRYWRDENAVHHVPKRSLEDIIVHLTVG